MIDFVRIFRIGFHRVKYNLNLHDLSNSQLSSRCYTTFVLSVLSLSSQCS